MHMHVKFVPNLTTTDLADALGIDQTAATRTLALLRKSGLVIDTPGARWEWDLDHFASEVTHD